MPTFILTINWTDQGIRAVRDAPKRSQAARELAKKVGVEIMDQADVRASVAASDF